MKTLYICIYEDYNYIVNIDTNKLKKILTKGGYSDS